MAEGLIRAPASLVYQLIADHREHHPKFLPKNFSELEIEQGGVGAGTITTFTVKASGRSRRFRMRVEEPEPGRVMVEKDTISSLVTTWTLTPDDGGTSVRIESSWQGASGMAGFFERIFASRGVRGMYNDELRRLDRYARQQASLKSPVGSAR
jgi:ribosome-associated toxin RatA of RatAB toxin-antitoxin module